MSLRSLFERLHNSGSPAYQDLIQLKETLDCECWQVSEGIASSSPSEDYTSDLIKRIAVYLSGPLNQVEDSLSSRFRILQLRTLIAALALLHHLGVEELHAEPWSRLRLNISDRFSDIPRGRRRSQSFPVEKNRRARALYLARLAAQYFSLFKRSLPRPGALVEPVLGLILTGASVVSIFQLQHYKRNRLTIDRRAVNIIICKMFSYILIKLSPEFQCLRGSNGKLHFLESRR